MNAALRTQAALMLQAPWQWSRNDSRLWVFWLYAVGLALLVGVPTLALTFQLAQGWTAVLMGVLGTVAWVTLWAVQFSALLRLDHPHTARFVVGHGRALRAAALGLWLAMVVFAGLLGMAALQPPGVAPDRVLLLVMLAAGATLLYVAMALRWWLLWLVIWLPFPFFGLPWVRAALQAPQATLRDVWQAHPVLATALALLAMATLLVNLFGKSDAAHARAYANRETFRRIAAAGAAGQKPTLAAYGRWGELLGSPLQRLADAWLAHVTRNASPAAGNVMARAEVVLFGAQHWVRHVGGIVSVQLVLLVGWITLWWWGGLDAQSEQLGGAQVGMSIGLASTAIAPLISLPGSLWGSRREQALLVLLPGMPQGAALNRALARQQMQHFFLVCAAGLPAFAALAWWSQSPLVLTFLLSALSLSAVLWPDPSRLRAHGPQVAWFYVFFVGLCLVNLLLDRFQPALLLPGTLVLVMLSAALLTWRWRRLSQWPQALPAGRLA